MDRLERIFLHCKENKRAALIIFASCGYPDMETSETFIEQAIESGADIIELGVPFSDPIADGPVICAASQVALKHGATLEKILLMAERIRKRHPETGLILFSYMNVLYHAGIPELCRKLKQIGIDGILAVDLPLEEREELRQPCRENGLHLIPLVSPATPVERMKKIVEKSSGFLYYISVCGVTGARKELPPEAMEKVALLHELTKIPIAIGFGISNGATAKQAASAAEAVIVGSAAVQTLDGNAPLPERIEKEVLLVKGLAMNLKK